MGGMVVLCHVRVGGVVAAKSGAAGLTYTQVYPFTARLDTLFTNIILRLFDLVERYDMLTGWIGMHNIWFTPQRGIYERN